MQLKRHKITGASYLPSKHFGGPIEPFLVVLHDTAGRLDKGNSAGYLRDNPGKASAHFVVEVDGSVAQLVPTNRRANHAGRSHYHGRDRCNNFSIGIEIVNPGRMTADDRGNALTWYKEKFVISACRIQSVTTPEHGSGWWMDYTSQQIEAVEALLAALFAGIPTLRDICTHWYVSPGRKIDTNPLFPLEVMRARILGRSDPADQEAEDGSVPEHTDTMVQIETQGSNLNMRKWPSINPNIIMGIPDGTIVPVIRSGVFDRREWSLVRYGGQDGWVVSRYTSGIQRAA